MFLLLAIVGGDREGTGGIQAGHVALGGGWWCHCIASAPMLGASPSGAAVPVLASPGHPSGLSLAACPPNSDSRRELFGETICARLLLGGCCSQLPAWEEPSMGGNQPRTHHSVCWGLRDCRLYPGAAPSHPFRNPWASLWTFMVRHILILSPSPPFNSFLHFSSSSVKALSSCPPACPLP